MNNVAYAMCCQMWKMMQCVVRCGGVMRCGIWCGLKYATTLNVGVVWNSCVCGMVRDVDCGCVMWNMRFARCGSVKWWWEADCGVM